MIWNLFLLAYFYGFTFFFFQDPKIYLIAATIFIGLVLLTIFLQLREQRKWQIKKIVYKARLQYNFGIILSLIGTVGFMILTNHEKLNFLVIIVYSIFGIAIAALINLFRRDFIIAQNDKTDEVVIITPGWIINKFSIANLTDIRIEKKTLLWSVKNRSYRELKLSGLTGNELKILESLINQYPKYTDQTKKT